MPHDPDATPPSKTARSRTTLVFALVLGLFLGVIFVGSIGGLTTDHRFAVSFAQMAKNPPNFEVTCPCCSAVLKIDDATRAVIAHTAAVKPKMFSDMEAAAKSMREQDSRRESIFQQSVEAQKHASDLLEKKFQEAVKRAKESPDTGKPIRDFDLD